MILGVAVVTGRQLNRMDMGRVGVWARSLITAVDVGLSNEILVAGVENRASRRSFVDASIIHLVWGAMASRALEKLTLAVDVEL